MERPSARSLSSPTLLSRRREELNSENFQIINSNMFHVPKSHMRSTAVIIAQDRLPGSAYAPTNPFHEDFQEPIQVTKKMTTEAEEG